MNLEDLFDREAFVEGVARGTRQFLAETDAGGHFGDLCRMLADLHLLKQGLLTADQACDLYQLARRTFDRKVAEKALRKEEGLGGNEPRFWLLNVIELLERHHVRAKTDEPKPTLTLVDLGAAEVTPRKRREKKAA